MAEPTMSFVVECLWVGVKADDLRSMDQRAESCAAAMTQDGEPVNYFGSLLIREDEVVLCFFEGSAACVKRAAERAEIPFERILEIAGSHSPNPGRQHSIPGGENNVAR